MCKIIIPWKLTTKNLLMDWKSIRNVEYMNSSIKSIDAELRNGDSMVLKTNRKRMRNILDKWNKMVDEVDEIFK